MKGYPFLNDDLGSAYENERGNIIEKVRAYHEDREHYESICDEFPAQRLAQDRGEPKKEKGTPRPKPKKGTNQPGLFNGN